MAAAWLAAALAALAVAAWFRADAGAHRVCCDALDYWRMAEAYAAQGWFEPYRSAGLRTWAYPGLLAGVAWIAAATGLTPAGVLFAVQFLLQLATSALLARAVFPGRPRASWLAFALLACNPYAAAYLPVALSDAPALACFQAWLAAVACWHRRRTGGTGGIAAPWDLAGGSWFAVAAVLAGLACALRPAYVWLPLLTLLLALLPVAAGWRKRVAPVAMALVLPWLALGPQVAINKTLFDRATPLPVAGLGRVQLEWGIANLKYATAPRPGADARMFYANPLAGDASRHADGVVWYLRHPLRGAGTLGLKLAGAFDFDFLDAYVWDREPRGQWLFRSWPLALLVLGLQGAWLQFRAASAHKGRTTGGALPWMGPPGLPLLVFLAWATVTLATVVELRFSLPMLSLLLPLAIGAVLDLRMQPPAVRARRLLAMALALAVACALAAVVSAQNVLLQP